MTGLVAAALSASVPAGTADAADCTRANCQDAQWVTACNAAATCATIPPSNTRMRGRLPPTFQMQKKPQPAPTAGQLNVPLKPYPPPSTAWMTGAGAPARKTVDRRAIAAKSAASTDAMREFATTSAGMQAVAAQEDKKAALLQKEQAAILNRHPQWVGDPTKLNYKAGTLLYPVHSCDEYAYKKNFEGAWFRETALALGSDYRAVYDVATRSDSPVRIMNRELWTFGTTPMGTQLTPASLSYASGNLFVDYTGATGATPPKPTTTAQAWATIASLEAAHRAMPDEEFTDIDRRGARFYALLEQLWRLEFRHADLLCRAEGHKGAASSQTDLSVEFECFDDGGATTGNGKGSGGTPNDGKKHPHQKVPQPSYDTKGRPLLGGVLRTNPLFRASPPATHAQRVSGGQQIASQIRGLQRLSSKLTGGGVARVTQPPPGAPTKIQGAGAGPSGSAGRAKLDDSMCKNTNLTGLKLQACYVKVEVNAVQKDVDDAVAFEKALGPKGCLYADPIQNHCNFSYQGFAELVTSHFDWKDTASMCRARIPDWEALSSKPKQNALFDKRILYPTQAGDYTKSFADTDRWFVALDEAPALWFQHDLKRKEYVTKISGIVAQGVGVPRAAGGGFGQSSGDGFDVGHPDLFGAGAHYAFSWALKPMQMGKPSYSTDPCAGIPCGVETRICRFNGAVNGSADASASLFGATVKILDASATTYAEDNAKHGGKGGHLDAHFTLLGNELAPSDLRAGVDASSTPTYYIARPTNDASAAFPDPPLEIGFMVGPIPVTLQAGMTIGAGIDVTAGGDVEDTCALPNGAQPRFTLNGTLTPHVEADAYGQAGVDLAVVDAGVRIDLNLVRVGLPVAFAVNVDGASTTIDSKADITLGALAGDVGIFAEVRYVVGSDTYDLPIFSWNGINASQPLFDHTYTIPTDALSFWLASPQDWRSQL